MTLIDRLQKVIKKDRRKIIGLMSGMSMDGINLALVSIEGNYPHLKIERLDSFYKAYPAGLRKGLEAGRRGRATEICRLNFQVGEAFANCVNEFLQSRRLKPDSIDAIGSHGQTVSHLPPGSGETPSTLQLGSGSVIAERTGILTVFNFRHRDMAVGGEGAPLVPLLDYLLYSQSGEVIALNNLGSISNVTVVTPELENVLAFDTGPANMPIDFFARRLPKAPAGIDKEGALSAKGNVHTPLLNQLCALPFFKKAPPKSAGYDEFGPAVLEKMAAHYPDVAGVDLVRTAVEFSATTIASAYRHFVIPRHPQLKRVLFSGGGVYNRTLMARLRDLLPEMQVKTLSAKDPQFSDAKEAMAFALLAHETLSGRAGNVQGATGARRPVILGEIAL